MHCSNAVSVEWRGAAATVRDQWVRLGLGQSPLLQLRGGDRSTEPLAAWEYYDPAGAGSRETAGTKPASENCQGEKKPTG